MRSSKPTLPKFNGAEGLKHVSLPGRTFQTESRMMASDPNLLSPEDAFNASSPPRRLKPAHKKDVRNGAVDHARSGKERGRSGSRKRKGVWKKLLWVKQSCQYSTEARGPTMTDQLQIPTTTRMKKPFSNTFSATPGSNPTTSGPWSPTPQSSYNTSAPSSSSSAVSWASFKSGYRQYQSSAMAVSVQFSDGASGTGGYVKKRVSRLLGTVMGQQEEQRTTDLAQVLQRVLSTSLGQQKRHLEFKAWGSH